MFPAFRLTNHLTALSRLLSVPAILSISLFCAATQASDLDLAPYRGKVVYVDFWASWCVPCRASFPWMNELHREHGENGLVILAVNSGDTDADRDRFLAKYPAEFRIVDDKDGKIAQQFNLQGMPTSYLYDTEGNEIARHIGFNKEKSALIREEILTALEAVTP